MGATIAKRLFIIGFRGFVRYIGDMANTRRIGFGLGVILISAIGSSGQTWNQTSAPNRVWSALASSADETTLIAVSDSLSSPRGIYLSTNSGATWVSVSHGYGVCAAVSADGLNLFVLSDSFSHRQILYSYDGGSTWHVRSPVGFNGSWQAVASSANGSNLVATTDSAGTGIFISHDAGISWVSNSVPISAGGSYSAASSADGTKLFAAFSDSRIYISTNSGVTWKTNLYLPGSGFISLASSADGNKLAVAAHGAKIYTSTNCGVTWTTNSVPVTNWTAIASSADGSKLVAAVEQGKIYSSTNSGVTWKTNLVSAKGWASLASSADGNLVAVTDANSGGIWISQSTPNPKLSIAFSGEQAALSWLVPSTNFVLQESADMILSTNVTNAPILNFANLQNEVSVSCTNSNVFYRLESP